MNAPLAIARGGFALVADDTATVVEAILAANIVPDPTFLRVNDTVHPREIARRIATAQPMPSVVLLNVDLLCAGHRRGLHGGIEVLKYLRLAETFDGMPNQGRLIHCVMYSFRSLEGLIREKSANAVLCSKGCSFRRLPFDITQLALLSLARETAQLSEWRQVLRGPVALPDDRHSWANWYAAWQLLRIHALASAVPAHLASDGLVLPNGPHERDAMFAYGVPPDLPAAVAEKEPLARRLRASIVAQLDANGPTRCIALIDDQAAHIDRRTSFGWHWVHASVLGLPEDRLVDVWGKLQVEVGGTDCDAIRRRLDESGMDLANCACVLLDLRLAGERGLAEDGRQLTGVAVLAWIRERWPTIPVIVTTASNRAQSVETLLHLGADAYWVKRGLDERSTASDLVDGYIELLRLVSAATSSQYQFMRTFGALLHEWEGRPGRWWNQRSLAPWFANLPAKEQSNRTELIDSMVRDIVRMLRQFLHRTVMASGHKDSMSSHVWIASIVQHAGKVLECLHATDRHPPGTASRAVIGEGYAIERSDRLEKGRGRVAGKKKWINGHKDGFGCYLMAVRNGASHFGSTAIDGDGLTCFLTHFACYIMLGPRLEFRAGMKAPAGEGVFMEGRRLILANPEYVTLVDRIGA